MAIMRDQIAKDIVVEDQNNLAPMSTSRPVAATDLKHQLTSVDLIIVGTVMKVADANGPVSLVSTEAKPAFDRLRQAEMTVVRTLAGAPTQSPVSVFFLEGKIPVRPWAGLAKGEAVLMFLRSIDQGYVPVEPMEYPIQTLPGIAPPPAAASRAGAVMHELEQVILTADTKSNAGLIIQASIARAALRGDVNLHLLDMLILQDSVRRTAWVAIARAEGKIEVLSEVGPLLADSATDAAETLRVLSYRK